MSTKYVFTHGDYCSDLFDTREQAIVAALEYAGPDGTYRIGPAKMIDVGEELARCMDLEFVMEEFEEWFGWNVCGIEEGDITLKDGAEEAFGRALKRWAGEYLGCRYSHIMEGGK